MSDESTVPVVHLPVVECSACHRPYVLRLAFHTVTQGWQYAFQRDCRCRKGMASATSRTGTVFVLERAEAARAAQDPGLDQVAERRRRSDR